jgi:hypothetical protein
MTVPGDDSTENTPGDLNEPGPMPPSGPGPSGYSAPPPGYGPPPPGYGTPPPGYGTPPPGYGQPSPGDYPAPSGYGQPQRTNGLAIASLTLSCLGFLCGGLLSIVGIVLGAVALSQIKQTRERGYGLAVAGIVVGVATLLIGLVLARYYVLR